MKYKFILIMILILISSTILFSQENIWYENFEEAKTVVQDSGKTMLINFSGSDWCRWCIKLKDEVFDKESFNKFAKENLVLMIADFPRRKKLAREIEIQNQQLASKLGVRGFPTIVLLNSELEVLAMTGYQEGGANNYVKHLKQLINKTELKK